MQRSPLGEVDRALWRETKGAAQRPPESPLPGLWPDFPQNGGREAER